MCRWASASSFLSLAFSGSIFCRRYEFREIPRRVHQQPVSVRVKQLEIFRSSAGGVLDRSKGLRIRLSWIIWITLLRSRREQRQSDRGLASNLPPHCRYHLKKINYNLLFYMIFVGLEEVLFFFCRGFIFFDRDFLCLFF